MYPILRVFTVLDPCEACFTLANIELVSPAYQLTPSGRVLFTSNKNKDRLADMLSLSDLLV